MLLKINKLTFEKSEEPSLTFTQKLFFLKKSFFSWFFFKIFLEEIVLENLEKNPSKLHYQNLIKLVVTQ